MSSCLPFWGPFWEPSSLHNPIVRHTLRMLPSSKKPLPTTTNHCTEPSMQLSESQGWSCARPPSCLPPLHACASHSSWLQYFQTSEISRKLWHSVLGSRGTSRENLGKFSPQSRSDSNCRISGAEKGKPARDLGLTLAQVLFKSSLKVFEFLPKERATARKKTSNSGFPARELLSRHFPGVACSYT